MVSRANGTYSLDGRMSAVINRLQRTRALWLRRVLGSSLLRVWGAAAGALLAVTLADVVWSLPPLWVSAVYWLVLGAALILTVWATLRTLARWPEVADLALRMGEGRPEVGTRLLAGLELWGKRGDRRPGYSRALIDAVAEDTWRAAADLNFRQLVPSGPVVRSSWLFGFAAAGWAVLGFLAPDGVVSSWTHVPVVFSGERVPGVRVEPGDCEVPAGESLDIRATVEAPGVAKVTLLHDRDARGWRTLSMSADTLDASADTSEAAPGESDFRHRFTRVERPFRYAVSAGKAWSDTFQVGIRARPKVVRVRVDYDYPEYTGLTDRSGAEGDGRITAVRGTRAGVWVEASRPLRAAQFIVDGEDTLRAALGEDPAHAVGQIPVLGDGRYQVRLIDEEGYGSERTEIYPIVCLPDEGPMVRILSPPSDATLPPDMQVHLEGVAHDDYGFSKVLLHFFRSDQDPPEDIRISGPIRTREYDVDYPWRLDALGLMPGDVLTYYVEVWDNDAVLGPKRAATDLRTIRFPSVAEIFAQVDRAEEEEIQELRDVYDEEQFLHERLQEISRDLKREEDISWETTREIEQTTQAQEDIHERLERVAEGLEDAADILEKNELLNLEILEKMARLRELVEEVATPEMREAMRKLQEALDELDRDEIAQALEDFEISQEDLLERLERSIELLERLRIEKKMEELAQVAEALAEREQGLADEAERAPADSLVSLAGRQDRVAREAEALEREVSKVADQARRLEPEAADALQSVSQAMERDEVVERLRSARDALSGNRTPEAQEGLRRGGESLDRIAQDLRLAQNLLSVQKRRQIAEAIERIAHDLVWFSFEQEGIAGEAASLRTQDQNRRRDVADRQMSLRTSASQLRQRIRDLARMSFAISPEALKSVDRAMDHMEAAARILESGQVSAVDREGLAAMVQLNRAVLSLMESRQCMSSCSSPMGFNEMLQRMQAMSCQQSGINEATQGLFSEMGQRGLSVGARAQMARLAAEQEAVRKTAQQLAAEMGDQSQVLGRMEGVISEMERVIEDLESGGLKPETIDRQNRILSRLLDAQKSIRRRDYARVRLSRVGVDAGQAPPPELPEDFTWAPSEIREDLLKAAGETYPVRYEALIRKYFRALAREGAEE